MRKYIYLSGPISNLPIEEARGNFRTAERKVAFGLGQSPVNPMELNHNDHDKSWKSYMKVDLRALLNCDGIYMMKDWHKSRGANLEYQLAKELGMEIYFEN